MKCPKCGSSRLVDNGKGKKCVNCDFEWTPKKTGCGTWLVLILIIIFVVPYIIGRISYEEHVEQIQQKAEQQKAENVQRIMNEAEHASAAGNNSAQTKTNNSSNNTQTTQQNQVSQNKSNSDSKLDTFGVWQVTAEEDEFNGSKNVYFGNRSSDYFVGEFNNKKYPVMVVRCKDNKTDVLINFDVVMTCFDGMKIGLKFDDDKPYHENWIAGTSCDALFARNPVNLLKKMANKKKLIVKFTPFQSGDINVTFDLNGIDKVKDKIAGVCHWKK